MYSRSVWRDSRIDIDAWIISSSVTHVVASEMGGEPYLSFKR